MSDDVDSLPYTYVLLQALDVRVFVDDSAGNNRYHYAVYARCDLDEGTEVWRCRLTPG